MPANDRAEAVFEAIRTRRAVRAFTDEPVSVADIRRIIAAARWASSAGNRRLHRFYVTRDPEKIDLISTIGPGFYGTPAALIVICTDLSRAERFGVREDNDTSTWIDVGTAAMNMQLMAHALGLGTTPVTSVSRSGLREALELPDAPARRPHPPARPPRAISQAPVGTRPASADRGHHRLGGSRRRDSKRVARGQGGGT